MAGDPKLINSSISSIAISLRESDAVAFLAALAPKMKRLVARRVKVWPGASC